MPSMSLSAFGSSGIGSDAEPSRLTFSPCTQAKSTFRAWVLFEVETQISTTSARL